MKAQHIFTMLMAAVLLFALSGLNRPGFSGDLVN